MATTALITGASSGIGLELARLMAADGVNLVLVARSRGKLHDLDASLRNVQVHVVARDLAHPRVPQEIFDELQEKSITVDWLVNNAGFGAHGKSTGDDAGEHDCARPSHAFVSAADAGAAQRARHECCFHRCLSARTADGRLLR